MGDRYREIIPGAAIELIAVTGVWHGVGGGVPPSTPSDPEWSRHGEACENPPPRGVPDLSSIFTHDAGNNLVPSGGVYRGRKKLDQHTGSLLKPTRVGHNCDPGGGQLTPPLIPPL